MVPSNENGSRLKRMCPADAFWVYVEHDGSTLAPVSRELLGKGRELANKNGMPLVGILLGHDLEGLAAETAACGADGLVVVDDARLTAFSPELYTEVVAEIAALRHPSCFLLGATPSGRDLAGRLAVKLETGLTADCTDLSLGSDRLLHSQTAGFGGGILATILCPTRRPQMATVRPGVFATPAPQHAAGFWTEIWDAAETLAKVTATVRRTVVLEEERRPTNDLSSAPVLVISGRGVDGNMEPLYELAELLGGAVGATRVAVDEGWIDREAQIGQTGVSVRPEIAIVLGASGAYQFTVGIEGAGTIVAVNTDSDAPIFANADYCVTADAVSVTNALIEQLRRIRAVPAEHGEERRTG